MYSPHAQKIATEIIYFKQLVHRARTLPFRDLEREVNDYEQKMRTSDERVFVERILDYCLGEDNFRFDQYQINKRVFDEIRRKQ